MNNAAIAQAIRTATFTVKPQRPRLLFDFDDVHYIRSRGCTRPVLQRAIAAGDKLLATDPDQADALQAYVSSYEALAMADAYMITGREPYADWAQRKIAAVLKLDSWLAPVHGGMRYDHCMGNVSAHVAMVHDYLADHYTPEQSEALAAGVRGHILDKFLAVTAPPGSGAGSAGSGDNEWWFRPNCESNWKIMTCGETGLAMLGFVDRWPQAQEAMARCAQAVLEVLDMVPAEGDWPEGINYWFATLTLGLRFARGLRRWSGGAINLFEHPALKATGDFPTMLTTPAGGIYNFNDNVPRLDPLSATGLIMLAAEHRRADWLAAARNSPADTALFLACDDPALPSKLPTKTFAVFPRTGVATLRSGWNKNDTFIGFKSGPSAVGHSHLDANSFVVEAGGQPLVIDHPYWPQAHFLGFFDPSKYRWNFDGPGTPGHSTLLIDGQGQTHGQAHAARIAHTHDSKTWQFVSGDASLAYPHTLTKFIRTILFLKPDVVVIRDVVECQGERHAQWLLHYAGAIRSEGLVSIIENQGVTLSVTPFLPDRAMGWRTSDVTRTSVYVNSDTMKEETRQVRYRAFEPFRQSERFEFLFGLRVGGTGAADEWRFEGSAGSWKLGVRARAEVIKAEGDGMTME